MVINSRIKAYFNIARNNFQNIFNHYSYPRFAHFFITWRCNLKCRGCNIWRKESSLELDEAAIRDVTKKLPFLDIIKITGGEPFEREDLGVIVNEVKKNINPYIIQVTTNGTYTDRIIRFIRQASSANLHLRVSLDGIGKVHDGIRGVEGCFKKVKETILALINLKKKYPFRLGINYGLRKETIPSLAEMHRFCTANKIGFIAGYPIKPFVENVGFDTSKSFRKIPEEVLKAYKELIDSQKTTGNYLESRFSNYLNRFFLEREYYNNFRFDCGELRDLIYILPNADLVICGLKQKKVANLLQEDFKNIWFGEAIEKFRREARNCQGCLQKSIKLVSKIYKLV